jgi:hypothetical protein
LDLRRLPTAPRPAVLAGVLDAGLAAQPRPLLAPALVTRVLAGGEAHAALLVEALAGGADVDGPASAEQSGGAPQEGAVVGDALLVQLLFVLWAAAASGAADARALAQRWAPGLSGAAGGAAAARGPPRPPPPASCRLLVAPPRPPSSVGAIAVPELEPLGRGPRMKPRSQPTLCNRFDTCSTGQASSPPVRTGKLPPPRRRALELLILGADAAFAEEGSLASLAWRARRTRSGSSAGGSRAGSYASAAEGGPNLLAELGAAWPRGSGSGGSGGSDSDSDGTRDAVV